MNCNDSSHSLRLPVTSRISPQCMCCTALCLTCSFLTYCRIGASNQLPSFLQPSHTPAHTNNQQPISNLLVGSDISLVPIHLDNILIHIPQNKFHRLLKIRHVPHLKFGPIPQKEHHIPISKQPLDSPNLHNIRIHNLCHILPLNTTRDANTTIGNLVSYPRLTCPCGCSGNDSYYGEDGDCGSDGFGDGGGSFVEGFFGGECGGCFGGGGGGGGVAFSFTAFDLSSTLPHHLDSIKRLISLFCRWSNICYKCRFCRFAL
mmetsp:Transcript_17110/g.37099  ORF Transcript_17110/g.37099 Transcript_17110/m.37099 type:complete len:260 (+) Transcript_17110:2386-3165(+)